MTMPRLDLLLDPLNQYLRQQNDLSLTPYQRPRQAPPKRPAEAPTGSPGWRQRQAMLDAVEQMLASQRLRDGSELPIYDRERSMLPTMEVRADAPQAFEAGVARAMSPALERGAPPAVTARVPGLGESLADVGKMTAGALYDSGASLVEGGARLASRLPYFPRAGDVADEVQRSREAMRAATEPTTGLGKAAQLPATMVAYGLPFAATAGTTFPILGSAALTGMQSQAKDASLAGALGVENPMLRGALDVGADMAFSLAGPLFKGAEAAGMRGAGQAVRRELGQELRGLQTLAGEGRLAPGLSTMDVGGAEDRVAPSMSDAARPDQLVRPTMAQEVRSVGRFGYVQLPAEYKPVEPLERAHVERVTSLVEPKLQAFGAPVQAQVEGAGLFGGDVSPNTLMRFAVDADDDAIRRTAAMRGLVYGQDQQLWYRPLQTPSDATTYGLVLHGPNGAPLPQATIDEVLTLARGDDALGPYGGATRDGDHLLFLNLKNYTGLSDDEFAARMNGVLARVQSMPDIQSGTGHFFAEEMSGTGAYLRALGNQPDALRAARAALGDAADEYVAYARAVGGDAAAARTRDVISTRIADLDAVIRQLENPPPAGKTSGAPLAQVARQVNATFAPLPKMAPEQAVTVMVDRLKAMIDGMVERGVIPKALAQNWYKGATEQQRGIARLVIPELAEEPKAGLYMIVNSILSSGQEVPVESRVGLNIMDQYIRTGRFSTLDPTSPKYAEAYIQSGPKKGMEGPRAIGLQGDLSAAAPRTLNHEQALQRLDALVQAYGEEGALDAMLGAVPFKVKGKEEMRPALIHLFGPKIGRYAMDKLGLPGEGLSTIDLWMARLFYMLRGDMGNIGANKLIDDVTPEMRRTMQAVLADYARQYDMPESSAQALAWYAIKNAFGDAGAREKPQAYATLGSATADAVVTPGKSYGRGIKQGWEIMTPGVQARLEERMADELDRFQARASGMTKKQREAADKRLRSLMETAEVAEKHGPGKRAGWTDATLRDFAKRIGRPGSIKPTAGAFAGRVFGLAPLGLAPFAGGEPFPVLDDERPRGRGLEPLGRR